MEGDNKNKVEVGSTAVNITSINTKKKVNKTWKTDQRSKGRLIVSDSTFRYRPYNYLINTN